MRCLGRVGADLEGGGRKGRGTHVLKSAGAGVVDVVASTVVVGAAVEVVPSSSAVQGVGFRV